MTEVMVDGVKCDLDNPLCSRPSCRQFSYVLHRDKNGKLICHRCVRRREVHKADMRREDENGGFTSSRTPDPWPE
jgi:hypothetical protein